MTATVVPAEEAVVVRSMAGESALGRRSPALRALLAGEVVHFDDLGNHFNSSQLRETHGLRLRTRRDDAGGRYWWTEKP